MIIDDCRAAEDLKKRCLLGKVLHSKDFGRYPLVDLAHRLAGQASPRMENWLLPAANRRLVTAPPDRCSKFALIPY